MQSAMRAFGSLEDLDLEFAGGDRPALVTAVLATCAGGSADQWWAQPVGVRIAALLRLFMLSEGVVPVELSARCTHTGCCEPFSFELPLHELAAWQPDGETWDVVLPDGRCVTVRRPSGRDLARWRSNRPVERKQALCAIFEDLVIGGRAEPEDEPALSDAARARDPLVALTLGAECPHCHKPQEVAVDLEGLVLARLSNRQRALLSEVHRLATRYGWSERQVLAVPPRRRAAYVALIDGEVQ